MKQAINFMFDGINSKDMGVHIAWNEDGLFEENFLPERKIIEKKIANREKPYFQRVEHEPLSFSLSFAIAQWNKEDTLRRIARWLFQPYYKPLVFDSNPSRVFYAIVEGDSTLFHNGMKEGYIELEIRCDSPYSYTPEMTRKNIEFRESDNNNSVIVDQSNFHLGEMTNMKTTSEGITLIDSSSTWGITYENQTTWGGTYNEKN